MEPETHLQNNMKKILLLFIFLILLSFLIIPTFASAGLVPCGLSQDDPSQDGDQTVPCELCHLFVMVDRILDFLFIMVVPPLAALLIVIGGAYYILSRGDPGMVSKAKSVFVSVAIGLVIIYGAWAIVNTFLTTIGATEWEGFQDGWWKIKCTGQGSSNNTGGIEEKIKKEEPKPIPPEPVISVCSLCPGNSTGDCDPSVCSKITEGCNFVSVGSKGYCAKENECSLCGTIDQKCDVSECNAIGSGCTFLIKDPLLSKQGYCASPGECSKCTVLGKECTESICKSLGNCKYIPAPKSGIITIPLGDPQCLPNN